MRFAVPENETPSDDYGLFTFNQGVFTGNSFGDLLLGLPNTTYFAVTGPRDNAGGTQRRGPKSPARCWTNERQVEG